MKKIKVRKDYDAIVIGTAIGGLISGALLARRGMQVLVVNQEQVPWSFEIDDFRLQREALWGQGFKRYLFETIFEELEITSEERLLFERSQPVFQVVLPKHRIDVTANRDQLMAEYRREFPTHIDAIDRFYAALDTQEQSVRQKINAQDLKHPLKNSKFVQFLYPQRSNVYLKDLFETFQLPLEFELSIIAQLSFLSHIHTPNPTAAQAALVLSGSNRKDYYFAGEGHELAEIFYARIRKYGGSIRDDAKVEKLHVQNNRISGARLSSYEGVVSAHTYLGNVDIHRLYDLLDTTKYPRKTRHQLGTILPKFVKCSFYVGVNESVLPVGMQSNLVLLRDELKPLIDDNVIFVHILPGQKNSTHRLVHVSFLLNHPQAQKPAVFEAHLQAVTAKVAEHMGWLVPFLNQNLVLSVTDLRAAETPGYLDRSVRQLPLYRTLYDGLEGGPRRSFENKTHLRNLFITGPEIFPALGLEGETISSLNTANLAQQFFTQKVTEGTRAVGAPAAAKA